MNSKAQKAVQQSLDGVTGDPSTGIAGIVFVAIDKKGNQICACPSGKRGLNRDEPMTMDTVFWIASCTKLICTIACMQAVEQGQLNLDDAEQVSCATIVANGYRVDRPHRCTTCALNSTTRRSFGTF